MNRRGFLGRLAGLFGIGLAVTGTKKIVFGEGRSYAKVIRLSEEDGRRIMDAPDGDILVFGGDHQLFSYCAGRLDLIGGLSHAFQK